MTVDGLILRPRTITNHRHSKKEVTNVLKKGLKKKKAK